MPLVWFALHLFSRLSRPLRLRRPSRPFPTGTQTSFPAARRRKRVPARIRSFLEETPLRAQVSKPAPPPTSGAGLQPVPPTRRTRVVVDSSRCPRPPPAFGPLRRRLVVAEPPARSHRGPAPRTARRRPASRRPRLARLAGPPENPVQAVSGQPDAFGVGLARDSSPLHPPPISARDHPPSGPPNPMTAGRAAAARPSKLKMTHDRRL